MQFIVAYDGNFTSAQTDGDLPALSDPTTTILNNHFIFPQAVQIQWAYALGNTLARARISTPRLRSISRPYIMPFDQAASPASEPQTSDYRKASLRLNPIDETQVLVTNNAPVGGERNYCVLCLGDGNMGVPPGDMITLRATTAFTPVADSWSTGVITLDDTIPAGRYAIVGMQAFNTGLVAARLALPTSAQRPGVVGVTTVQSRGVRYTRDGYMGEFGRFDNTALPLLDVLQTGATTNPTSFIDVVKVG